MEKSDGAKDELIRKANKSDQLSRELEMLESEKDRNMNVINKLNVKRS